MGTSKLQIEVGDLLDKTFPQYHINENYRPEWLRSSNLTKLELDFYIEELKIAFEVQGAQHFQFTPHFHKTEDDFKLRQRYDEEKKDLCRGAGVKLIEICTTMDAVIEIKNIEESLPEYVPKLGPWINPWEMGPKRGSIFPKSHLSKKIKPALDISAIKTEAIDKYKKDYITKLEKGDPIATTEEKLKEIRQFIKVIKKFRDNHNGKGLRYFQFNCLGAEEMKTALGKLLD